MTRGYTVVLDDDPTGTQAASGVTVLLEWDADDLAEVLEHEGSVYLQTNSRAIDEAAAVALAERIRGELAAVRERLGSDPLVVLRGDSTLRGHVFVESDVFAGPEGRILFVPAFPAGGRTTIDGVHRVRIDGVDVPVGETEFAADPVFGYRSSRLVDWAREVGDRDAVTVPLDALRETGGRAVAIALALAEPGSVVAPDAETDDDIRLIHEGLKVARFSGTPVVVRSAATLAAVVAGAASTGLLDRPITASSDGVLVVCGSHTGAASAQLAALQAEWGLDPVEIPTDDAREDPEAAGAAAAARASRILAERGVAIVSSERVRRAEHDGLADGDLVMRALMAATSRLARGVGVIVSKGGITSAEVARNGVGATRARVRGQIAPGISVWDVDADGPRIQVVVPGNVGDDGALVDVMKGIGHE
jgi:uncharacterized protein YgbK (DUF1537 family)